MHSYPDKFTIVCVPNGQIQAPMNNRYFECTNPFYLQEKAVEEICSDCKLLYPDSKTVEFISQGLHLTFGKFLSVLSVLDELKNSKASIKNDFSAFRR